MTDTDKPILVAVSIDKIVVDYPSKRADFRGMSSTPSASFRYQSGLLNPKQIQTCELLIKHGFTVVVLPKYWQYDFEKKPGGWQVHAIEQAMKQVASIYEGSEGPKSMTGYDVDLARSILIALKGVHPQALSDAELKHLLNPEPSDEAVLTALDALQIDGLISGKVLRTSTTRQSRLAVMANIRITPEGQKSLTSQSALQPTTITNIHNVHGANARITFGQITRSTRILKRMNYSAKSRVN